MSYVANFPKMVLGRTSIPNTDLILAAYLSIASQWAGNLSVTLLLSGKSTEESITIIQCIYHNSHDKHLDKQRNVVNFSGLFFFRLYAPTAYG